MKKTLFSLACAGLALVSLGACDGGSDGSDGGAGGDGSGGTSSSGGSSSSGGTTASGGSSGGEGGDGSGGGGADPVAAFCAKFEADCGFGAADRYEDAPACTVSAAAAAEDNPPMFDCRVDHLGRVATLGFDHCAHAFGSSTCTEAEYPPP